MKATKYDKIEKLPAKAKKVSLYAEEIGQRNPAYVCIVYDRYLSGKGTKPPYKIVNWQGSNFVVPE